VQVSELLRVLVDPQLVDEGVAQAVGLSMEEAVHCLQRDELTLEMAQVL
jgi:hypothetical protein